MLLCFPAQNFTEIGRSAAELWPKTAAVRHLEFYGSNNGFFEITITITIFV